MLVNLISGAQNILTFNLYGMNSWYISYTQAIIVETLTLENWFV